MPYRWVASFLHQKSDRTQMSPLIFHGTPGLPVFSESLESFGVLRSPTESSGVPRSPTESHGVLRSPTESSGVPRSPPESHGVPRSPTESYGVPESAISPLAIRLLSFTTSSLCFTLDSQEPTRHPQNTLYLLTSVSSFAFLNAVRVN